jgi:BASS family bile acid:Na+ symporter
LIYRITSLFPLWILIVSIVSFIYPPLISWFKGDYISFALALIMLGMGLTLTLDDFKRVFTISKICFYWSISSVYTVMPISGYAIAYIYDLPTPFAVGLILVACCPGGTASNVLTFIAKADVALSVTLTSISTLLSVALTPLLTLYLAGNRVDVNSVGLLLSTLKVIILPVAIGVFLNYFFPKLTKKLSVVSPLLAVLMIMLIVASVIAANKAPITESGFKLLASVFSLHIAGFFFGYILSILLKENLISARTISIEVGMQNSGLGVLLARENFTNPLTAVPCAISSLAHSLIASVLAAFWRRESKN